jgi:hypothetical protein
MDLILKSYVCVDENPSYTVQVHTTYKCLLSRPAASKLCEYALVISLLEDKS